MQKCFFTIFVALFSRPFYQTVRERVKNYFKETNQVQFTVSWINQDVKEIKLVLKVEIKTYVVYLFVHNGIIISVKQASDT